MFYFYFVCAIHRYFKRDIINSNMKQDVIFKVNITEQSQLYIEVRWNEGGGAVWGAG